MESLQQKVDTTLLRYLIPDLADMVLEYCWTKTDDHSESCVYGNYEKAQRMRNSGHYLNNKDLFEICYKGYTKIVELNMHWHQRDSFWSLGFVSACCGGHAETVKSIIDSAHEWDKKLDWRTGIDVCFRNGHFKIVYLIAQEKEFQYCMYRRVVDKIKNGCTSMPVIYPLMISWCGVCTILYAILRR